MASPPASRTRCTRSDGLRDLIWMSVSMDASLQRAIPYGSSTTLSTNRICTVLHFDAS